MEEKNYYTKTGLLCIPFRLYIFFKWEVGWPAKGRTFKNRHCSKTPVLTEFFTDFFFNVY